MPKELWDAQKTADFLGITKRAVYQRVYRGAIPYVKLGSASASIRFDPDEIAKFVDDHRVQAFAGK